MSAIKTVILTLVSALMGGLVVAGIIFWKPALIPEISQARDNIEKNHFKTSSTEKELFESMESHQQNMRNQLDSFFNDDFFNQEDPFEAMRKFRQRMEDDIKDLNRPSLSIPFDSWFGQKFGGGTVEDIEKREDDDFVYYDIKINNVKGTTVNTKVENGYLTITGQVESSNSQTDEGGNFSNQSIFSSSFSRTFPLPANVDENAMQTEPEESKIVIKFPKKKN